MNWGKGLMIFIIAFIITMLSMVFYAYQQENQMIEENYYIQELKYQKIIDAKNNLKNYKDSISIIDSIDFFTLNIPNQISNNIKDGTLEMIKYDDKKLDKSIPFKFSKTMISKDEMMKGLYHLKIKWVNDTTSYFYELDREFQ